MDNTETFDLFYDSCPDVRNRIFQYLLGGSKPNYLHHDAPLPPQMKLIYAHWSTMQLVCKRWKALTDDKLFFAVSKQLPLRRAIVLGSVEGVRNLLTKKHVDAFRKGSKPFLLAVESGNAEIVRLILEKLPSEKLNLDKNDLLRKSMKGGVPIMELLWNRFDLESSVEFVLFYTQSRDILGLLSVEEILLFLLDKALHRLSNGAKMITMKTSVNGNLQRVLRLMVRHAHESMNDVKWREEMYRHTPMYGYMECVMIVMEEVAKFDPNREKFLKFTLDSNKLDSFSYLFEHPDMLIEDPKQYLLSSSALKNPQFVNYLLTKIDSSTVSNRAIYLSASSNYPEALAIFLKRDPNVDPSMDDNALLRVAYKNYAPPCVRLLLGDKRVLSKLKNDHELINEMREKFMWDNGIISKLKSFENREPFPGLDYQVLQKLKRFS